jgi:hypothetical protein
VHKLLGTKRGGTGFALMLRQGLRVVVYRCYAGEEGGEKSSKIMLPHLRMGPMTTKFTQPNKSIQLDWAISRTSNC